MKSWIVIRNLYAQRTNENFIRIELKNDKFRLVYLLNTFSNTCGPPMMVLYILVLLTLRRMKKKLRELIFAQDEFISICIRRQKAKKKKKIRRHPYKLSNNKRYGKCFFFWREYRRSPALNNAQAAIDISWHRARLYAMRSNVTPATAYKRNRNKCFSFFFPSLGIGIGQVMASIWRVFE